MIRYTATIFLSAFLLFLVQPMVARFILPWFGGTAAVWTTCMMFFQSVLLLGYLYSHLVRRWFSPRTVCIIHAVLMLIAAFTLRTAPPLELKPTGGEQLTIAIVTLLAVTVGLPFFVLTTTGPLIQAWHSLTHGGKTYRLYAVSNLGSILALLCYPFVFERIFKLREQATFFVYAYLVFAALCIWSAWQTSGHDSWKREEFRSTAMGKPGPARMLLWVVLSMAPSIVLLATTNLMCQEVASIPFLWILPLSLYLLTLIICFDRPALYRRVLFIPLLFVTAVAATLVMLLGSQLTLLPQVITLAIVCLASGMVCHGELERIKPEPEALTLFYLMVSVGGALGGIFVAVVAPQVFSDYFEFHLGLIVSIIVPVAMIAIQEYRKPRPRTTMTWVTVFGGLVAVTCVLCSLVHVLFTGAREDIIARVRNEYGLVLIVDDVDREGGAYRAMINGRTEHGGQFTDPARAMEHSGYYIEGSGPELAITTQRQLFDRPLRIGVIGLGTGSLVTWMNPDDEVWFYEINPVVEKLARDHFTYLESRDQNRTTVLTGDGRAQLEQQYKQDGGLKLDVLCMDAFTSDSIPAHLLTRECFELYLSHLNDDGVLVAHITNAFVDMRPVLFQQAKKFGLNAILVDNEVTGTHPTRWVLLTRNDAIAGDQRIKSVSKAWPADMPEIEWTDDFSSLASLVDWSVGLELDFDELKKKPSVETPGNRPQRSTENQ